MSGRALPPIYAITDRKGTGVTAAENVRIFLEAGIRCVQLREKDLPDRVLLAEAAAAAERDGGDVVALVDPPWTTKAEWTDVPDALARAVRTTTRARFVLWYPVKSLTRPNAMLARLADAGVAATVAELITTPLEEQRNRLNGSGVLLVRPPDGAVAPIAAAAPVLGARCATHPDTWSLRVKSWGATRAEISSRLGRRSGTES